MVGQDRKLMYCLCGIYMVCINIDISPEMAAQSAQQNQAFCVTASDWSPIRSA